MKEIETIDLSKVGPDDLAALFGTEAKRSRYTRSDDARASSIDGLIERRDKERRRKEGERDREALWKASVKRLQENRRQQTLWDRLRYHEGQLHRHTATFEHLIAQHQQAVETLERELGITKKGAA